MCVYVIRASLNRVVIWKNILPCTHVYVQPRLRLDPWPMGLASECFTIGAPGHEYGRLDILWYCIWHLKHRSHWPSCRENKHFPSLKHHLFFNSCNCGTQLARRDLGDQWYSITTAMLMLLSLFMMSQEWLHFRYCLFYSSFDLYKSNCYSVK